ncbi:MAG: hypothetical protein HY812_13680 [Planctomycetes bacterium]|nr:hypothetical protein [Planctomycetota bacterium]
MSTRWTRERRRERGSALVIAVIFSFLAIAGVSLFLARSHIELVDSKQKSAAVRSLFNVHSALGRAHAVVNESMNSLESQALNMNVALAQPEMADGVAYVSGTNHSVRVRTVKPSSRFDADGNELPPADEFGAPLPYEGLPYGWYVLEARMYEPLYTLADGATRGQLKLVRQYVRDGTPLSNNFVAVIDDDLGLGGSPVNPGKPAEGEIITNKHLYIMTANPYYANRLLAVDGVSYTAGATEANTLYLPLPSSLTSNPDDPDDTLKAYSLGANPQPVALITGNMEYAVTMNGVASADDLKAAGGDPTPSVQLNCGASGTDPCQGMCVEGNVNTKVTFSGETVTVRLSKATDANKWIEVSGLPTPDDGVLFFDTRVDVGGVARRTQLQGAVTTRTTLATTGNVDVCGSVRYYDAEGDAATKQVYTAALEGVDPADCGTLPEIPSSEIISPTAAVSYFANQRPYGVPSQEDDGFYDGDAVLGVVASQDVILLSQVPQNAEIAGAYLSLQKRLTLEGMGYNAAGQLVYIDGSNPFYVYKGGRSSIRRFGSLVSYKRPATTVVTGTGAFLYGFRRGFSLFDEAMKQQPPPFFPKDKKPQYLGWELKDLGVKTIQ